MNVDRPLSSDELDRLARYLAGGMSPAEQQAFEHAILEDPALAEALYSQSALAAHAPAPAARVIPLPARRRVSWRWTIALPAAAALIAVLVLNVPGRLGRHAPPDTLRGTEAVPKLLAPVGALEQMPVRFTWTAAAGASTYRLVITDLAAKPLYEASTGDTSLEIAAGVLPATLSAARWRVVAYDEAGLELPIPAFVEFRVAPR
jgi:hypothetical protein